MNILFKNAVRAVLFVCLLPQISAAETFTWSGTGGGSFWDAANWTNETEGGTATAPRFGESDTYIDTVTVSADGQTITDATGTSTSRVFVGGGASSDVETLNWQAGTFTNANGAFVVGLNGTGLLNQSGGTINISTLYIAARSVATSNGTYTITDGALKVSGTLFVAERGTGVFNQDGGNVTANTINFSGDGSPTATYNLNGGSLTVSNSIANSANSANTTFSFNGGTLVASSASASMTVNTLNVASTKAATLNIGGTNNLKTVTVTNMNVGADTTEFGGTVNQGSNANVTVNGTLSLNTGDASAKQTFYYLNSGTLKVGELTGTGKADYSRFAINGGSLEAASSTTGTITGKLYLIVANSAAGSLIIGNSEGDSVNRITSINSTSQLIVGGGAKGTVTQNGGSVSVANIYMGAWNYNNNASAGSSYTLNNGTLKVTGTIQLGERNEATIIQNGGSVTAGAITFGLKNEGAMGDTTYQLNGGTLTVSGATQMGVISGRKGFFELAGGTWTQTGALTLGQANDSSGQVTMSSGTWTQTGALTMGQASGGSGQVTMSNGTWTQTGTLTLGLANGGSGQLTMSNGTWTQNGSLLVGQSGTGTIVSTGGTATINGNVYMADKTDGNGIWTIGSADGSTNPTVSFNKNLCIGHRGAGSITLNSGTMTAKTIYLGGDTSSNTIQAAGSLTINGGVFKADSILYVNTQDVKANQTFEINGGQVSFSRSDFSVANNGAVVTLPVIEASRQSFNRTTYSGERTWDSGNGLNYDPTTGTGQTTVLQVSDTALPATMMYVYTTNVYIDEAGDYYFESQVDDMSRLFINGTSVLDRSVWNATNTTGAIALNAGWNSVELRAYGGGSPNNATLKISSTGAADSFQLLNSGVMTISNLISSGASVISIDGDYSQSADGTTQFSIGVIDGYYTQLQADNIDLSQGKVEIYLGDSALTGGAVYDLLKVSNGGEINVPDFESVTTYLNGVKWDYPIWDASAWSNGVLKISPAAVPEPSTWLSLVFGFALIIITMNRRKRWPNPDVARNS